MQRRGALIVFSLYLSGLLFATVTHAQAVAHSAGVDSFAVFFWKRIDWASFGTAAFLALVGGAIRTGRSLRSPQPIHRVLIEGMSDAVVSLICGGIAFVLLMLWQVARDAVVNQWFMFAFCLGAGMLRGGFIDFFENTFKRVLGAVSDGAVNWVNAAATKIAAKQNDPSPPPTPPET